MNEQAELKVVMAQTVLSPSVIQFGYKFVWNHAIQILR